MIFLCAVLLKDRIQLNTSYIQSVILVPAAVAVRNAQSKKFYSYALFELNAFWKTIFKLNLISWGLFSKLILNLSSPGSSCMRGKPFGRQNHIFAPCLKNGTRYNEIIELVIKWIIHMLKLWLSCHSGLIRESVLKNIQRKTNKQITQKKRDWDKGAWRAGLSKILFDRKQSPPLHSATSIWAVTSSAVWWDKKHTYIQIVTKLNV